VFPWLAGAVAQGFGLRTLLPYLLVLGVLQALGWWRIAHRMRSARDEPVPVG
jgi:hypothetical protein